MFQVLQKSGHTAKVTIDPAEGAPPPFVAPTKGDESIVEIQVLSAAQLQLWATLRQGRRANGVPLRWISGSSMECRQLNCVSYGFKSHYTAYPRPTQLPEELPLECAETQELLPVPKKSSRSTRTRRRKQPPMTIMLGARSVGLDSSSGAPPEF